MDRILLYITFVLLFGVSIYFNYYERPLCQEKDGVYISGIAGGGGCFKKDAVIALSSESE